MVYKDTATKRQLSQFEPRFRGIEIDLDGKKPVVRAEVAQRGTLVLKQREFPSAESAAKVTASLLFYNQIKDADTGPFPSARVGSAWFSSENQKNLKLKQIGSRLPEPFKCHKPRRG